MAPIYHALGMTVGINVGTAGTFVYDPEYLDETHPDSRLQLDGFDIEAADRIDRAQPGPDRPFSIILMCSREAKIDQYAVAHVPGDEAIEPGDDFGDGAVIGGDDLAQILGIEPR